MSRLVHRHRRTWKEGRVVSGQRVLVVDGLAETEQVLKAVLEPRGLHVDRVRRGTPSLSGPDEPKKRAPAAARPNVLVLHEDQSDVGGLDQWGQVPRVVIGSMQMAESSESGEYLPHPFQYRELIGAIERLLSPATESASY